MATDGHGIRRGQDGLHTWLRRENGLPGDGDVVASHLVPVVRACDAWQPLVQLHLTIRDGKHVPLLNCRHFPVLLDVVEVHDAHLFLQRLSGAIQVSRHDDARRRLALRRGRGCRSPLALSFVHQLPEDVRRALSLPLQCSALLARRTVVALPVDGVAARRDDGDARRLLAACAACCLLLAARAACAAASCCFLLPLL